MTSNPQLRLLVALVAVVLPGPLKHLLYTKVLGWEVDPSTRIGVSFIYAQQVRIGGGGRIGHLNLLHVAGTLDIGSTVLIGTANVVHGCELVEIGDFVGISHRNWISGPPLSSPSFRRFPDRRPELRVGHHAIIIGFHRIECSDAVTIGSFSTIAGDHSEIGTHRIDVVENIMRVAPVDIGEYCYVGTRVIIQAGAHVPDRTVVAPGAVVAGSPGAPGQLIGGVPARVIKQIPEAKYFTRDHNFLE